MNKRYYLLVLVAAVLIVGAGCKKKDTNTNASVVVNEDTNISLFDDTNENVNASDELDVNADVNVSVNTNVSLNTNTSVNTNSSVEDTTTNTNSSANTNSTGDASSSGDVTVTKPVKDEELVSPFYVEGTATTGTQVFVRVKSGGGTTIFTEPISVKNEKFRGKLLFDFSTTSAGSIEVFQKDSAGDEVSMVAVPVKYKVNSAESSELTADTNEDTNTNANANTNTSY